MYDTQLYFYLINFRLEDFILNIVKNEILMFINNKDPLYYFNILDNYNIYLFDSKNKILCKLPLKIYSLNDQENIIENSYNTIINILNDYLSNLPEKEYPSYVGLYISTCNIKELDIESLWNHVDKCKDNMYKMQNDLLLPISKGEK